MTSSPISRKEVGELVSTLDPELQRIWTVVELMSRDTDTTSDDFQIAARIEDVFVEFARRKKIFYISP